MRLGSGGSEPPARAEARAGGAWLDAKGGAAAEDVLFLVDFARSAAAAFGLIELGRGRFPPGGLALGAGDLGKPGLAGTAGEPGEPAPFPTVPEVN
jgi:hypothetical protein